MLGATVGVASQYFGDPISCEFQGISSDLAEDYCWIHGSYIIPPEYQPHLRCIVDQENFRDSRFENTPDTSFYQWVTFVMAIQASIFYLPYKIWSALEGGLLQQFGRDGANKLLLRSELKYEDGVVMEAVVEKFVKYFKSIHHHNSWYFAYYMACEISNHLLLGIQFYLTDLFLDNKFSSYGWDVLEYYSYSKRDRLSPAGGISNPMCSLFPTEVSCSIPVIGAAGDDQSHNGICVLTQNIINEKMYLILWFWYLFLLIWATFSLFSSVSTVFFEQVRFGLIYKGIRHKYDKGIEKSLKYVLSKCQLGDWFVLYQLYKNCNTYFYREFVKELAIELKRRPKKSKKHKDESSPSSPQSERKNPTGLVDYQHEIQV